MRVLKVDAEGLQGLAAQCDVLAGEIGATDTPQVTGLSCQRTSAAVGIVNLGVSAGAAVLVSRMSATSAKLSASATGYSRGDDASGGEIQSVRL
jgi:hypothetical protein